MYTIVLGVVLLAGSLLHQADAPPVFRAGVYTVPFQFSLEQRFPFGIRKAITGLTVGDITVVLDSKDYPPNDVTEDQKRGGHYFASFTPPEVYRDGKAHTILLRFRIHGRDVSFPGSAQTVTFPKPPPSAPADEAAHTTRNSAQTTAFLAITSR